MINKDTMIIIISGALVTLVFTLICFFIEPWCSALCLLLGAGLTALFYIITKKRYEKLSELNDYLALVCSGNYNLDIPDNDEGELSILKNNLYKVITILKTQNEALEADKLYLADSLADISHQLKTPLTSMMVMTDLLKVEKSDGKREEFISVIEGQLTKMKWLITNLLKLSRLDAGTIAFAMESHSSRDIISSVTEAFSISLEIKGISLVTDIDDFDMNTDKGWTVEALQNILKNCIEHTPKDGTISITAEDTNIYSIVRIKDNGCGIAKEDLPHIFERFYHGKNSSDESVGIGLALAKLILEKQRAEITASSTEAVGTEFTIKFYKAII